MRLDIALVERGFIDSRNKASELIKESKVLLNGKVAKKPSIIIEESDHIEVDLDRVFVSRAGAKLYEFLEEIDLDLSDIEALDIGSSTGGFTQALLLYKIKRVVSVDVGKNQMHSSIKDNPKVELFEEIDIREFSYDRAFELITCDVSFISINHILKSIDKFAKDKIIILFKPQFEVGINAKRDKKGVVQDLNAIKLAKDIFLGECLSLNWKLVHRSLSKIKGKSGNIEEFFYFKK
jgi:23S rRNA (cytidine1920-2'-O)/16S rRNA (cytidine1409-2'-O)-methyltransferase